MLDQPTKSTEHQYLVRLRQLLVDYFSDEELRNLCFDLHLNYDALPAIGTHGKAREVILALGKQSRLPELVAYVCKARPNLTVDDLPPSITADALAALSAESAGSGVTQTATGSYIAQAASGGTATVNVYSYFPARPDRLRRSFDALMADKLQGFVGRQFVFDALDEFLKSNPSGYFIIRGAPGIGKTALMAKLINDRGYVHHFNVASQNIRSPRVFLENICAQLIARYDLPHKELPPNAADDGGFLMQCLSEAAANFKNHPIVVAIDSLDEADRLGLAPAVNTLYLPSSLPQGVYIVVTTRPLEDLRLQVMQKKEFNIEADSEGNLRDIDAYIVNYGKREAMRARITGWKVEAETFIAALRKKSQGNFMYLYHVLPAIEQGKFMKGTLDELPDGLMDYYQRHWRQMREGEKEFETVCAPIVCILGVAQEPVTTDQIAAWTRLSPGLVKDSIGLWREFLEEEQIDKRHCYRIYHASFQDFLKEQVDLVRFDDMIAEYYLSLSEQGK